MTTKPDFPALLSPGKHTMTIDELRALAVTAYPHDVRRAELFGKWGAWRGKLTSLGLTCTAWLDGSFLSTKPGPGDIDLVVWDLQATRQLNLQEIQEAYELFDHAVAKATYDLDLYLERPAAAQVIHRQAYWMGFLGFCHDRKTAKGFAEVAL